MKEVLTAMGVPILTKAGYEADDILGNDRETLCGGGRGGFYRIRRS